ncbi:methyltransferase domain-containing protein [Nonomuraea sp. NPDC049269]|uniref:class I SAM-dependent methyltransferase n=1 Tax=Nonomuraea sp. NPDC049269 TaxID=3364349 RepID=UPI00371C491C
MDLDAFTELLTPRGQRALAEAVELVGADPVAAATRLRRTYDAALTSAALTQAGLRDRARAKFGADAASMYFTPHGLEQATRAEVGAHRARRLATPTDGTRATSGEAQGAARETPVAAGGRPGWAGETRVVTSGTRVVDVCCGIGGDFIALARAGCLVDAVDLDPLTVAVARANAEALGLGERVTVRVGDAATVSPEEYDWLFADPARRTSRGRTFDPMAYSPPWPVVLDLVARAPRACLKVAPGIPYEFIPAGAEAEWVSYKGEVKEAALWTGSIDATTRAGTPDTTGAPRTDEAPTIGATGPIGAVERPGDVVPPATVPGGAVRRATLLPGGETLVARGVEAQIGPVGRYVYEPDGAAIRAHLVGEVAEMVNGRLPDPMIAYITSDEAFDTPWAARYSVEEVLPFSLKRLRATLRERQIGNVVIKKRASAVDIERLRNDLRLSGDKSAVIVLTRVMNKPSVLICHAAPPA